MRKIVISLLILIWGTASGQDALQKIRSEGLNKSQVMENAFYLTDVSGPRLNNSPGYIRAAKWAVERLKSWGLDARLEPWGNWGKGWELKKSYVAMTAPYYKPMIAFPKAWCNGTEGPQQADLLLVSLTDSASLESWKGRLKGKLILLSRNDSLQPGFEADAKRFSDSDLVKMAAFDPANAPSRERGNFGNQRNMFQLMNKLKVMARDEEALAIFSTNPRGKDGTLFVSGGGSYAADAPGNFPDIVLAYEDYMSLMRLLEKNIPVRMELDVQARFYTDDTKGYNVVGELRGSDPGLKNEWVIIGGHLDSWHAATGATDNAAGCSVMLEVMRILQETGLKPRRSIRICLWGGEEQGLHGSRNYVKNHFTDTVAKWSNAEGEKVSAYYNLDNGTGKIRGVYLQGNAQVKTLFSKWLESFADLGAATLTLQNTGGTDHLSFDAIGIPGFQFIQDPVEYDSRTHHTNMDTYDHLIPSDLKQAASIIATFVYNTAQMEEKIPRKAKPQAGSGRQGF